MSARKFRWSKVYESSEEELTDFLRARNITASRSSTTEQADPEEFTSSEQLRLWCAEGSMTVKVDGKSFSLQPGDAMSVPAHTTYQIIAGISGYTYYT